MLIISLLLLAFLFIVFILYTAIGLTFKLKVLSLEEKKELRGTFTVKWLLFSHTFSVEEPWKEKTWERENLLEGLEKSKKDGIIEEGIEEEQSEIGLDYTEKTRVTTETQGTTETQSKAEVKRKGETEEEKSEEIITGIDDSKEKREKINEIEGKETEIKGNKEKRKKINEIEGKNLEIGKKKEKRGIIARIRGKKKVETEEAPEAGMDIRKKLHWGLEAFKALRKPAFRLISDLLNGIKIKRLESYITFGLSDPADTGMLCGFIHSVTGLVYSRFRHCSFSINPVFMDPMIDFRGNMEVRVRIYSLVFPVLKFIFNGKTLSFTYSIIKEKLWEKWKFHS